MSPWPIFGHETAWETLSHWKEKGVQGRSFLFCGPRGIGKRTLALYWAASFVCKNSNVSCNREGGSLFLSAPPLSPRSRGGEMHSKTDSPPRDCRMRPCGECPVCRAVREGNYPDLLLLAPEAYSIPIARIREAREWASLASFYGGQRFLIIDEAERLQRPAANALLKLLEEPEESLLIILVSAQPGRLLATMRSRTFVLALSPPPVSEPLLQFLQAQVPEGDPALIARWFRIARGSLGLFFRFPLSEWEALRRALFQHLFFKTGKLPFAASLELAAELKSHKADSGFVFALWASLLRDFWEFQVSGTAEGLVHGDLLNAVDREALRFENPAGLSGAARIFLRAQENYRDVLNPDLFWESAFYEWAGE